MSTRVHLKGMASPKLNYRKRIWKKNNDVRRWCRNCEATVTNTWHLDTKILTTAGVYWRRMFSERQSAQCSRWWKDCLGPGTRLVIHGREEVNPKSASDWSTELLIWVASLRNFRNSLNMGGFPGLAHLGHGLESFTPTFILPHPLTHLLCAHTGTEVDDRLV